MKTWNHYCAQDLYSAAARDNFKQMIACFTLQLQDIRKICDSRVEYAALAI